MRPRTPTPPSYASRFPLLALLAAGLPLALGLGSAPPVAAQDSAAGAAVITYSTTGCQSSAPIKESSGIEYTCPGKMVMAGVKHSGDENGNTQYQCCSLDPQNVEKTACAWSKEMKESNSNYVCSSGQAMVGRWHNKDENGPTKYNCCNLINDAGQVLPDDTTCYWSNSSRQSKSDLQCKAGEIMRGRSHQGDENGPTEIYCCKFKGDS